VFNLDGFALIADFHRQHAMRLLRTSPGSKPSHDQAVDVCGMREALIEIWPGPRRRGSCCRFARSDGAARRLQLARRGELGIRRVHG